MKKIKSLIIGSGVIGAYLSKLLIQKKHSVTVTSRFLKKAFDCEDQYRDSIIDGIVERQKSFPKEDQPEIAMVIDDCLGSIYREAILNYLCSRFQTLSFIYIYLFFQVV